MKSSYLILPNLAEIIGSGIVISGAVVLFILIWSAGARKMGSSSPLLSAFIALPVVSLAITIGFPLAFTVILSFGNMDLFHFRNPDFGIRYFLGHLREIFTGPILLNEGLGPILGRTMLWTAAQTGLQFVFGFVLALALQAPIRGKRIFQTILILPWAIPGTISLITLRYEFHPTFGFINLLISKVAGQETSIPWWSNGFWNFMSMNIVGLWLGVPFMMVIILGALRNMDQCILEAAEIDGAGRGTRLFFVVLPLLSPTLVPAVMFSAIYKFNEFGVPYFMNPQALETSQLLSLAIYSSLSSYSRYSFSSALALVNIMLLLAAVSLAVRKMGLGREVLA